MKFLHKYFIYITIGLFASKAYSQDLMEAYQLSNLRSLGTARSLGFGSTLGSIGGDFSSGSVNPAGLAVFRKSEIAFTPSLQVNSASSQYASHTTNDNNVRATVNNWSIVLTDAPTGKRYDHRKWKTVTFAIGLNRMADFNHDYQYRGTNTTSSATQAFESDANFDTTAIGQAGTLAYLGWQGYLINRYGSYFKSVVPYRGGIDQTRVTTERGRVSEFDISLAGNYQEKLLLGATLGISKLVYKFNSTYSEALSPFNTIDNPDTFKNFLYGTNINLTGTAENLKLGAIWKPTEQIRIGAAFHTPTLYQITDVFSNSLKSNVGSFYNALTVDNGALSSSEFAYQLATPYKLILSGSVIVKSVGFISADYEFVDYSTTRFIFPSGINAGTGNSYSYEAKQLNNSIKNTYQGVSAFRVGTEIKLTPFFLVRGGAGITGNPYRNSNYNANRTDLSFGLGFRSGTFFADFGVMNSKYKVAEAPYTINFSNVISGSKADIPQAITSHNLNCIALTMGVKF